MKTAAALILLLIPLQDAKKVQDPDVRRVTISVRNVPLNKLIGDLQKDTGIPIELDEDAMKRVNTDNAQVSFEVKDLPLTATLKLLLQPHGFKVVPVEKKKVVVTLE